MSDMYQPIYDAVRSRISNGDIGAAVRDVAWSLLDISHAKQLVQDEIVAVAYEMRRPSVLFRPTISLDGNKWCALYGSNLQDGVAGFGDTPAEAMTNFDIAFLNERPSRASRDGGEG